MSVEKYRQDLHRLVDQLADTEAMAALRFLEFLHDRGADPIVRAFAAAPPDDEPVTGSDEIAIREAHDASARGEESSLDEAEGRLLREAK